MLKPVDDNEEVEWVADLSEALPQEGFRVPQPVRTKQDSRTAHGWTATEWLPGYSQPVGRWTELLDAARALHHSIASIPRPDFLDRRQHQWALADRLAWGEATADPSPAIRPLLDALLPLRRPVAKRSQLVHGDLAGNVIFTPGEPPAIIDLTLYWRPPEYAAAVAVLDGVMWYGAPSELLDRTEPQMLIRAIIFRLASSRSAEVSAFEPMVRLARRISGFP